MNLKEEIKKFLQEKGVDGYNEIVEYMSKVLNLNVNPVSAVKWVNIEKVEANNYNPNSVPPKELKLLYTSIKHDGYTQPVVTIYDKKRDKYVIIDGFHRYFTCKSNRDIYERNKGLLPIVVLNKGMNDRMASTIRHNRARGEHSIGGMSSIVYKMLQNGWSDKDICNELGMEPEELIKLKHITGFSKLFEKTEYNRAWLISKQLELIKKYKKENKK